MINALTSVCVYFFILPSFQSIRREHLVLAVEPRVPSTNVVKRKFQMRPLGGTRALVKSARRIWRTEREGLVELGLANRVQPILL